MTSNIENPMYLADAPEPERCVADMLPGEAQDAIANGGNWDGVPHDIGGCDAWYWQDDDSGEWRKSWYPSGYAVEDGKLYLRYMNVDSDGDWEFEDEAEVGTPDEKRLEAEYSYERWKAQYREYIQWVADNADDPMNEFYVSDRIKTRQTWRAQFNDSILGLILVQGKRKHGKWMRPEDMLSEVRAFCSAHNRMGRWICEDYRTVAELRAGCEGRDDITFHRAPAGIGCVIEFTLDINRPNPHYRKQLVAAARKALRESREVRS